MTIPSRLFARLARLPKPTTRDLLIDRDLPVPMPDGVTLLADRYRPNVPDADRLPLLLNRNPYGSKVEGLMARVLAERGYQAVVVRCRGTFGSGGEWEPFVNEQADGHATLAWVAEQPWFNGGLGMFGGSYHGLTQWAVAEDPPPSLKAIALSVTTANFADFIYPGGSYALESTLAWASSLESGELPLLQNLLGAVRGMRKVAAAADTVPLADADVALIGHTSPFLQDWLTHEDPRDPYWTRIDFGGNRAAVPPAVFVAGWYDIFGPKQVTDYEALRAAGRPARLVVGPWHHGSPGGAAAALRESFEWMEAHVAGRRATPSAGGVRLFVLGARQWVDVAEWPPQAHPTAWHLHPSGNLAPDAPPVSEPDRYRYDPADPTPVLGGRTLNAIHAGPKDNRPTEARADVLTYSSAILDTDVTVIGPIRATLHVRSTLDHTDVFARLCDVDPKGRSTNLCDGLVRLTPGQINRQADGSFVVRVELGPTANTFLKGHRIRLQVSSGAHPLFARNHGGGEPLGKATTFVVADQEVLHDPEHPSSVELPVLAVPVSARRSPLSRR